MIKVIIGYKLREGADIAPLMFKLRSYAMTCPGFVEAENLLSDQDSSIAAMVSSWEKAEDWKLWVESMVTQCLLNEAKELLEGEPKWTTYRIMPTTRWPG